MLAPVINWLRHHKITAWGIVVGICTLTAFAVDSETVMQKYWYKVNVAGPWRLEFLVKKTTYQPYLNKAIGYKMHFSQDGQSISATGEADTYDGKALPYNQQRVRFDIKGSVVKDSLFCTYVFHGAKRTTTGSFRAKYNDGVLNGYFSGNAANSSGLMTGFKE